MLAGQGLTIMKAGSKWKVVASKLGQPAGSQSLTSLLNAIDKPPQLQLDIGALPANK